MRKDLQTANRRVDQLNTLILDLTTNNKNKTTENKILITNNIHKINNHVTNTRDNHIVTTENRTNATLQKDNKKKQKEVKTHIETNQPPKHTEFSAGQQTPPTLTQKKKKTDFKAQTIQETKAL